MIANPKNRIQPYLADMNRQRPESDDGKPRLKDMLAPGFFDNLPADCEPVDILTVRDMPGQVKILRFNGVSYGIFTTADLAIRLRKTSRTIASWVSQGAFPTPVRICGANYWCAEEVLSWGRSKYLAYCFADAADQPVER